MTHGLPEVTQPTMDPCSVLAADVHGISFVHEVGATLAMANQGRDECSAALSHLVHICAHRVTACERPGRLADNGEEL